MEFQVVIHEGADEVVTVVVAFMPPQGERLTGLLARSLESFGIQLILQEVVGQSLIYQDAFREGLGFSSHEFGRIMLGPFGPVFTQIAGESLFAPGAASRRSNRRKCRDRTVKVGVTQCQRQRTVPAHGVPETAGPGGVARKRGGGN